MTTPEFISKHKEQISGKKSTDFKYIEKGERAHDECPYGRG